MAEEVSSGYPAKEIKVKTLGFILALLAVLALSGSVISIEVRRPPNINQASQLEALDVWGY